jgi:hypothetical protein
MRAENLRLESLLLDPNNYRLQDEEGFRATSDDRFHLEQVQRNTLQRLRETGLKELHDSIMAIGFLPIERIVVAPYAHGEGVEQYLVIEGNRRVAALKQIREEQNGGVEIPPGVAATLEAVPCLIADEEGQDPYFRETLMGIRHVGGIKQWGGYQRAKLIADLRDGHNLEASDVAAKLGLSTREVNRRYRAFKALQQMREDDEYGDYAEPALYPLFHEAVEVAEVREWLGWDARTNSFTREEPLSQLYALITPSSPEDGGPEAPPKIKAFSDVRQLKNILPNNDARRYLLDPERTFLDALTVANREELSRKWRSELTEATASLEGIGALEVRNFTNEDVALLDRLIFAATQIREVYQAVNQG